MIVQEDCYECEVTVVVPYYDDDEVFWCGKTDSRVWCSSACHEKSAERWWSNHR